MHHGQRVIRSSWVTGPSKFELAICCSAVKYITATSVRELGISNRIKADHALYILINNHTSGWYTAIVSVVLPATVGQSSTLLSRDLSFERT